MDKKTIVSGIQPTGNLHIGNYLGAVKQWVSLQESDQYDMHIFIADLHALSGTISSDKLQEQTLITAAELLAAGVDPNKTTFWVQSHVPVCTELAWVFNTVTPIAELERMTQYKDKASSQKQNINAGLLTYPILQAADILLYRGNLVPVGKDQVQHVELTRNIARWFNNKFDVEFFDTVKEKLTKVPKVMSLLEPTKKMSKSAGLKHVIELADEPEVISAKLKKAVTASDGDGESPGAQNLLLLLREFAETEVCMRFEEMQKDGSIRYGDLKVALTDAITDSFKEFRAKRKKLLSNVDELADILVSGATKADAIAQDTIKEVRNIVGIA